MWEETTVRLAKSVTLLLGLLLFGLLVLAGCGKSQGQAGGNNKADNAAGRSLLVYSGAGLKNPVEEIGAAFQGKS